MPKKTLDTSLSIREIELAILQKHGGFLKVIAVPNVSYGLLDSSLEADLIVLSSNGYATEYEIKRSWNDFVADFKKKKGAHLDKCIFNFAYVVPSAIGAKCQEFLELNYNNPNDRPALYTYSENGVLSKKPICGQLHTQQRKTFGCREMTEDEKKKLMRLSNIRFWDLLQKTPCNNCNFKKKAEKGSKTIGIFEGENKLIKVTHTWANAEKAMGELCEQDSDKDLNIREL